MKLRTPIIAAVSALSVLITSGTVVFHSMEDWSWIESLYFSVVTITTVGYGDIHPTSDSTRLVAVIYIIVGVSIAISALGVLGGQYMNQRIRDIDQRKRKGY